MQSAANIYRDITDYLHLQYERAKKEDKLFPVMLLDPVPVEVLQMTNCGCASARLYSTSRYVVVLLPDVMFHVHAGAECNNVHTRTSL